MSNYAILHYIDQLRLTMKGDLWIDETFDKKLREINESNAFIRPLPEVHSVAEVLSHLLEWRLSSVNVLRGGKKTVSMDDEKNWRGNEALSAIGWQSLLAAFHKSQEEIIELLSTKSDAFLDQSAGVQSRTMRYYADGLVHHDMYHLGQIGLIIKLLKRT